MLNTVYELEDRPPKPDPDRISAHQDSTLYFECPNVDEVYDFLISKTVPAKPPKTAPYGMRHVYVVDPDGFNLCFQHEVEHKEV
jgi:glyoxylase I family protein